MIAVGDLRGIAEARLEDATVLRTARRYDGAVYLCGYVVEIGLKARICGTLKWNEYPATASEFQRYQSFRTHDLDVLLHLSGREAKIKGKSWPNGPRSRAGTPAADTAPMGLPRHQVPRTC